MIYRILTVYACFRLRGEADLDDYVGGDVRAFVIKRDYLFKEHMDMLLFHGVATADVAWALNEEIRENSYQANNRLAFRRLHLFYLQSPTITDQARQELNMNDAKQFLDFIKRSSFVFATDADDTHIISKRSLPKMHWNDRPLERPLKEIVDLFRQMHRQEERGGAAGADDDQTLDPDDLDDIYSGRPSSAVVGKSKKNQKFHALSSLSVANSIQTANPFAAANAAELSVARQSTLDDLSDFHATNADGSDLDENPWLQYPTVNN